MADLDRRTVRKLFFYLDGKLHWRINPSRHQKCATKVAGCVHGGGYRVIRYKRKAYQAHRLVYAYFYHDVPKYIDHINGDKLDNRIDNLRPATTQQNGCNRKVSSNNSTGCTGVTYIAYKGAWQAQIKCMYKQYLFVLGRDNSEFVNQMENEYDG